MGHPVEHFLAWDHRERAAKEELNGERPARSVRGDFGGRAQNHLGICFHQFEHAFQAARRNPVVSTKDLEIVPPSQICCELQVGVHAQAFRITNVADTGIKVWLHKVLGLVC